MFTCASCAGEHQQVLQKAGCENDAIAAWCAGLVSPAQFHGSRILTNASWGDTLNRWAAKPASQRWSLCYSTFTDNHETPAAFHRQCDGYNTTLTFAHNSLRFTFGGYVR